MKVQLTRKISGTVVYGTLVIESAQIVSGGGSRNIITWALLAKKAGYNLVQLQAKDANYEAKEGLRKAVEYANELLNPVGSFVSVTFRA